MAEPELPANHLWTVREAAAYFRVSPATIWRWCNAGLLPAFKIGREWRISRPALDQLIGVCFI
jgi:excisionase family DNA binding protein